jgi:DNA repair exonuclease SbcCD ATPase subunit
MEKLDQIQQSFNRGTVRIEDIEWLIQTVKDLEFETEVAIEAYNGQYELAKAAIDQNDELREQLKQANKQIQELESEITVFKSVNNSI